MGTKTGRLLTLALAAVTLGCAEGGYRIVYGPATLTVSGTAFSPGVSVTIEDDGVAWFGPEGPEPGTLGYLEPASDPEVGDDG